MWKIAHWVKKNKIKKALKTFKKTLIKGNFHKLKKKLTKEDQEELSKAEEEGS